MELLQLTSSITARDIFVCGLGVLIGRFLVIRGERSRSYSDANQDEVSSQSSDRSSLDTDSEYEAPSIPIRDDYSILSGRYKMVLCVNMSLQMGKGKIAAQCGHATLGAFQMAQKYCRSGIKCWFTLGQAKIALKVQDDEKLLELERQAKALGLVTCLIQDAGHTQIAAGSRTVLAIGPAPYSVLDELTGTLKLL